MNITVGYPQTNRKIDTGKTLTRWPVFVDHYIFDSEHDKKGDEFFNINWSEITTEHVLTLLCCFATEYNNVVSADYIRTMTDTVTKQDNEYSPYEPFVNMIKAFYRMELAKVPQGKLTGKDNIF